MAVVDQNEEEVKIGKSNNMAIVPTTLATIESLTFPLVQEVVLLADFRCKNCQDRVADIVSKLNGNISWPVSLISDHKFGSFQDFLIFRQPKLTGEADSVEISLMEKRVTITLTRRRPRAVKMSKSKLQQAAIYRNATNKSSLVKRIFCSSSN